MKGLITLSFYANVSLYRGTTAVLFIALSLPVSNIAVFYLAEISDLSPPACFVARAGDAEQMLFLRGRGGNK